MTITDLINLVLPLGEAGLLILVGVGSVALIVRAERTLFGQSPVLHTILESLRGLASDAIRAGETLSLEQVTKGEAALTQADKKAIADSFYALIPNTVYINGRGYPVGFIKSILTQSEWELFVQKVFDEGDALLEQNRLWLQKQLGISSAPTVVNVTASYTANTTGATLQSAKAPQSTNITVNEGTVVETLPAPTDPTPNAADG